MDKDKLKILLTEYTNKIIQEFEKSNKQKKLELNYRKVKLDELYDELDKKKQELDKQVRMISFQENLNNKKTKKIAEIYSKFSANNFTELLKDMEYLSK